MVRISNLSFSYDDKMVLNNFSYNFPDVGIVALVGPSGVGKTTLLRLIAGLEKSPIGEISDVPKKVSYVFQENRLLPWYSALENVWLVSQDSTNKQADASTLLYKLGIDEDLQCKMPSSLSGGQRQRVCIARALFYCGDIMLLDEPFTGLDYENREIAISLIREYAKTHLVILVSHIENDITIADEIIKI